MARIGHKRHGFNKFAHKVHKKTPIGLKYGGNALIGTGMLLGHPEMIAAGYGAKKLGQELEK